MRERWSPHHGWCPRGNERNVHELPLLPIVIPIRPSAVTFSKAASPFRESRRCLRSAQPGDGGDMLLASKEFDSSDRGSIPTTSTSYNGSVPELHPHSGRARNPDAGWKISTRGGNVQKHTGWSERAKKCSVFQNEGLRRGPAQSESGSKLESAVSSLSVCPSQ
ncbi:hypothetical protein BDW75DRAFT_655 [Aspergillus navahoensis]